MDWWDLPGYQSQYYDAKDTQLSILSECLTQWAFLNFATELAFSFPVVQHPNSYLGNDSFPIVYNLGVLSVKEICPPLASWTPAKVDQTTSLPVRVH